MATKQTQGSIQAPDGSQYVTLTDGAGNLAPASGGGSGGDVTNAGTFAVQNTAALPSGTNVIGHVITDSGSVAAVTLATEVALTTVTHASVSTSTTSGAALASNANARYRCFQNKSTTINITLNLGATAVAGTGIYLLAGQTYELSPKGGNLFKGTINAIADSGTPALTVTEGV